MKKLLSYYPFYILLCIVCWSLPIVQCSREQSRASELEDVISHDNDQIKTFKDEQQRYHSQNSTLVLQNAELLRIKLMNDEQFKNLRTDFAGIKKDLRNIQYVGITGTQSTYHTNTIINKDTVFVHNLDTIKADVFNFTDSLGWYSLKGINVNGKLTNIDIKTRDSLVTVVTWRRKWFLGKKRYTQEMISYNPHTQIHYNQSILVKKR